MELFITRELLPEGREMLENAGIGFTEWTETRELEPAELIERCKAANGLLSIGPNKLDRDFLESCAHLKVVSLHSVGYDHIDIAAAKELGIRVGNTPGVLNRATADLAFLLMLSVSRKSSYMSRQIAEGSWGYRGPYEDLGIELHGKTIGIFGLGSIGFEMAKRCRDAFGMKVIYHNRSRNEKAESELGARPVSFGELLSESDVVSVHANLSDDTKGVFDARAFAKMKSAAIFVNAARGAMHDEKALYEALVNGTIWGAGLDVTNPEPMSKDNPLLGLPGVCVLPHIGSSTQETRRAMMELAVRNAIAGLKGEEMPAEVVG
jgi:glyoxylate reductase